MPGSRPGTRGPRSRCSARPAARQLRDDPWKLLLLAQIRPDQADWFARMLLEDQANQRDPRRGRALVVHLLVKASRDGHTAVPADAVLSALSRFGIDDPGTAVVAAVDDGTVLPFEPAEAGFSGDEEPGGPGSPAAARGTARPRKPPPPTWAAPGRAAAAARGRCSR